MTIPELEKLLDDLQKGMHTLTHKAEEAAANVHRQEGAIWAVQQMIDRAAAEAPTMTDQERIWAAEHAEQHAAAEARQAAQEAAEAAQAHTNGAEPAPAKPARQKERQ